MVGFKYADTSNDEVFNSLRPAISYALNHENKD